MVVAFVSRRCADSADFCRLLARSELRDATVVYVEEAESIPWYVDAVPTLVVEEGGTIEVYAQDDAFRAIGPTEGELREPERHEPEAERREAERREAERREEPTAARRPEPKELSEPRGFDGDVVFEGIHDPADEPGGVACGSNFETLIDGDDDDLVTARTVREWERGLAAERKGAKREGSSADKQLERLMQQREEQTPAPVVARM
jgi:hypothetical protein